MLCRTLVAISTFLAAGCLFIILWTFDVSISIPPPRMYAAKTSKDNKNLKHSISLLNGKPIGSKVYAQKFRIISTTNNHQETSFTPTMPANTKEEKISHIGFLKVYKAGTTTLANIFYRFGLKYNLTFALPNKGYQFLQNKSPMPVKSGNHRDILACHSIYSRKRFRSLLPEDSIKIGIIREPSDRMISAAYYYRDVWKHRYLLKVPRINFIHNLIKRPDLYDANPFSDTKNAMGHVFGFAPSVRINDTEEIEHHLDMLKNDFHLVLVKERYEESIILLKRTLNWELSDVIYLHKNSHKHQPVILSPSEHKKLKSTCFLDYAVYDTFYAIFEKRIAKEGPSFASEVENFKSVLQLVKDFCEKISVTPHSSVVSVLNIPKSKWNEPFNVTKQDCYYMQMKAMDFIDYLKCRHKMMNRNTDKKYKNSCNLI